VSDSLESAEAWRDEPMEQAKRGDCTLDHGRSEERPARKSAGRKATAEQEGCGKERCGQDAKDTQRGAETHERRQARHGGRQENTSDGKRPSSGERQSSYPQDDPEDSDRSQEEERQPGWEEPQAAKHLGKEESIAKGIHPG